MTAASSLGAPPRAAPAASKPATGNAAKYLEAAIRMYRGFEFERALQQLERARNSPSEGLEMDVAIGLYEGIIQLELGREDQAQAAFKTALSLNRDATLPISVSPKVAGVFDKVKASILAESAPPPIPTPVPAPVAAEPPVVVKKPAPGKPLPVLSFVPAAVGVAFGAAGTVLLLQARERSDALNGKNGTPNLATAQRYRDEGKMFQTLGAVGIGLAAAGIATTVVLLLLPDGSRARVSLMVGPTGAGISGRW